MDLQNKLLIRQEVEALIIEFWYQVDHHLGLNAHEYFVDDGVFTVAGKPMNGVSEIKEFYLSRSKRGPRVPRHITSSLHVVVESENRVSATSIMTLFVSNGQPVFQSKVPNQIADMLDVCVRGNDGKWRFLSRALVPIFQDDTPLMAPKG